MGELVWQGSEFENLEIVVVHLGLVGRTVGFLKNLGFWFCISEGVTAGMEPFGLVVTVVL